MNRSTRTRTRSRNPERGRKAIPIFLSSTLHADRVEGSITDPTFYQLVDQVQRTMENSPPVAAAVPKAVARLPEPRAGQRRRNREGWSNSTF